MEELAQRLVPRYSGGVFSVVGLTGGIGSGKSAVAGYFRELGVPVVDADQVSREVVEPGTEGLSALTEAFGVDVLQPDGTLDRKALGAKVFGDPAARRQLEGILHPRILQRSVEHFQRLAAEGHAYVVYEAALLVEGGRHEQMAALVVVAASEENQLARVMARDGLTEEQARQRLAAQLPLAEKVAVADHVIVNDGTLDDAKARTAEVHQALLARFGPG